MLRAAIPCALVALVSAAPAHGAVATESSRCASSYCNGVIDYFAEPGENNIFSTQATSMPTQLLVLDAGGDSRLPAG